MSTSHDIPDHTNPSGKKVKDLQQNNESQRACDVKQVVFAYNTKIFLLIHYDDFFLSVYKKAFEYYGFKVLPILGQNIKPQAIIIIDDFTNNCPDFISHAKSTIQVNPALKNIPIMLPGDSPPSDIAERIIYSLSKNQK